MKFHLLFKYGNSKGNKKQCDFYGYEKPHKSPPTSADEQLTFGAI